MEAENVQVIEATALEALNRSEIEAQVETARRWPRRVSLVKEQAQELACLDEQTAASCFYSLPRSGKRIEGPSVRLAEIMASSWGNLRFGARIVEEADRYVVAQGFAADLEKNTAVQVEVRRRITDRNGHRFSDDMIAVTCNAACSIAFRNALFKVVPFALVKGIFEQCKQVSLGKDQTMEQRRANALEAYARIGAKPDQVLAALDRRRVDDITIDDLLHLRGMLTAIKDGELTLEEAMRPAGHDVPAESTLAADLLAAKAKADADAEKGGDA